MNRPATIESLEDWCARHAVPLVRAVRHDRRWYVVLSDRRREVTGNASTLDEALAHAAGLYCVFCEARECDR